MAFSETLGGAIVTSLAGIATATLGTPRIGPRRELKTALEAYWSGTTDAAALINTARALRATNWARQKQLGITVIPSNDFSLYDHVLDTSAMVGAIPSIYCWRGGEVPLPIYFAMARGTQDSAEDPACGHGPAAAHGVKALEMTKWFDTNYHYMVPEFADHQTFALSSLKVVDEFVEAKALGHSTRPVLLGPVTYLRLGKSANGAFDPFSLLPGLLPVYVEVLQRLAAEGARWVQIDEPCLVRDLDRAALDALARTYAEFARAVPAIEIVLTTYFGGLGDNLDAALALPVGGLHFDLVRAPAQLDAVVAKARRDLVLSLGVVDGRNVWRADLASVLDRLERVVATRGTDRVQIAPSCSLLHVPLDVDAERDLDPDVKSWLAFATQKMSELAVLGTALVNGRTAVRDALATSANANAARSASRKVNDPAVAARVATVGPAIAARTQPFPVRAALQRRRFDLPRFPTTTIGSFPQTAAVRKARAAHANGGLDDAQYAAFLRDETARAIRWQEAIGLDVLVHGEFERNDMVQYFGERLSGFAFTTHGWVQSYGSRCVRPPILFGDVSRTEPITVDWWIYAQSLTDKPVKGMLTGPVTILNWSFVRNDAPRSTVCRQIALAIRDEVIDLETAGATMIQIDEAALREGLPLRTSEWTEYLEWAVESFRLAASGVRDDTQIHTHMCYSDFNDIIDAIAAMDADVISMETSRSKMELLGVFERYRYPNAIGPGVYDIHSPRVPAVAEMVELLSLARRHLADDQLWVNPDCGLKTRRWDEVRAALTNMVEAARVMRASSAPDHPLAEVADGDVEHLRTLQRRKMTDLG
jgi:5-methyltetrahydropteroyltriglutamate--homocysteine methyltransferase